MTEKRHANATTTPEMREFIQTSDLPVAKLARILNISEATVRKWKKRENVNDASNIPIKLNTTLTPPQEYVVVQLKLILQFSLNKLLLVTQQHINPQVSRSGLARCLKRHGVSQIDETDSPKISSGQFDQLRIGDEADRCQHFSINHQTLAHALELTGDAKQPVVHVMAQPVPEQYSQGETLNMFVASDPQSDWAYVDIYSDSAKAASTRYMKYVLRHAPFHMRRTLAENYHVFKQKFGNKTIFN
ncbi:MULTISPECIES: transcriptional regulator [unclassified Motilimonas]|uniref:transcriptional regulator n=1 Tax=Motilimonas TaxID=1914248 RepID=UPI001E4F0663|nr:MULTISPECIES: transcriptional regulator [unclassified Motilimonas]MCE0558763.1 transcriptional regulator [Motilimonas sp. E26]MDO6527221.1 transcriptional regulator [Motilimonas sp. 1_MG-2023]